MTTTLRSHRNGTTPTHPEASTFGLEPPAGGGRSRWPEVTVGMLIIGLFALAGGWLYSNAADVEPVLALRNDIERGRVVTTNDLRVVDIGSEGTVNLIPSSDAGRIVGQVALADLSAGTLATSDLFARAAQIAPGTGVVGLALDPGEYPTLSLRPGDIVRVVATSGIAEQEVLVERAEIVDVAQIGVQNQLFVSLLMSTEGTDAVAAASADDRVRLIQVGGE
ncbi:MAG: SAF domain-containing protein [Actinomycetota bacterium]